MSLKTIPFFGKSGTSRIRARMASMAGIYHGAPAGPFLEEAFTTVEYSNTVTVNDDGTWSYEQDTVLQVLGRPEPFHHVDRCTLRRVAAPAPNPALARSGNAAPQGR